MSRDMHSPGDEAAALGAPLSNTQSPSRPPPGLSLGTKSLRHHPRPEAKPGPCCRGPRRPTQQSSRPSVLVFWKILCMADTRSSSWMWKTWNCRQTGQGCHRDVWDPSPCGACAP